MAGSFCGGCYKFPQPQSLTKKLWRDGATVLAHDPAAISFWIINAKAICLSRLVITAAAAATIGSACCRRLASPQVITILGSIFYVEAWQFGSAQLTEEQDREVEVLFSKFSRIYASVLCCVWRALSGSADR